MHTCGWRIHKSSGRRAHPPACRAQRLIPGCLDAAHTRNPAPPVEQPVQTPQLRRNQGLPGRECFTETPTANPAPLSPTRPQSPPLRSCALRIGLALPEPTSAMRPHLPRPTNSATMGCANLALGPILLKLSRPSWLTDPASEFRFDSHSAVAGWSERIVRRRLWPCADGWQVQSLQRR